MASLGCTELFNHSNCPGANNTGLFRGLSKRHTRPAARMRAVAAPLTACPAQQVCDEPLAVRLTFQHQTSDQQQGISGGRSCACLCMILCRCKATLLLGRISCIQQKAAPCWPPFWHMALLLFLCCHHAEFYTSQKANMCVACGETGHYLRYRVVPACYRKALPERLKSHRR
jgi:hypothetical protein